MATDPNFASLGNLRDFERPATGWLRAIRQATGLSAGELGRRLGVSRQLPLQFERAEAADTITLRSLRTVAAALGYDLVYALVPRTGISPASPQPATVARIAAQSAVKPQPPRAQPSSPAPAVDSHFCD